MPTFVKGERWATTVIEKDGSDDNSSSTSSSVRAINAAVGGYQCHQNRIYTTVSTCAVQGNSLTGLTAASADQL